MKALMRPILVSLCRAQVLPCMHVPIAPRVGASVRTLSSLSTLASQIGTTDELVELHSWLTTFSRTSLPLSSFDIRYARSRGSGGQNVNKVNTKVDMRFIVDEAHWLPLLVRKVLKQSERHRINNDGELIITSERHRTQGENYQDCVEKLYECIARAAATDKPTSAEKKSKIAKHITRANEQRIQEKKMMKSRKADRRGSQD